MCTSQMFSSREFFKKHSALIMRLPVNGVRSASCLVSAFTAVEIRNVFNIMRRCTDRSVYDIINAIHSRVALILQLICAAPHVEVA